MKYFVRACLLSMMIFLCLLMGQFGPGQGITTVTTAGTPVRLSTSAPPIQATVCTITAASTNTGTIWIGFSSAVNAVNKIGTPLGPPITAGQPGASYSCLPASNVPIWSLNGFWLDATVSGDKVSYSWR